jgi:hypothetical protein
MTLGYIEHQARFEAPKDLMEILHMKDPFAGATMRPTTTSAFGSSLRSSFAKSQS